MPFDQPTRRLLEKFVAEARNLLVAEFTRQLQNDYGLDPVSGTLTAIEQLGDIDDARRGTGQVLRQIVVHYRKSNPGGSDKDAIDRLLREQSFTVLNRLAAVRMAEARRLIVESVAKGFESKAFRLYSQLTGPALGDTAERYHRFLVSLFDELSLDLPVLFDRYSKQGRLFPREGALVALFKLLDAPAIEPLWGEDETIGWIYQYYNDPAERKRMREASSAPRNSRELAVRNQFFTPRYVVEFLTDNTLGRLWYEMTRGGTALRERCRYLVRRPTEMFLNPGESAPRGATNREADAAESLSQEELLRQPVYIPHRPLKDPRETRLLDPACGSMHFGLYAFDLYTVIYDEAWDIAQSADEAATAAATFAPFVAFTATFPDKDAFLREVPRLIVEHNLHGIDIDPRAAQIAGLSLWLRAQRAWHDAGVAPANRPRITRSNVVCAEPMPGEKELLREFVEQQFRPGERPAFGFLLEKIFDRMILAGEAGSLLRIDEEIRTAIAEARALAQGRSAPRQTQLFPIDETPAQADFDLRGLNDEQFWEKAEQRIYEALEAYAKQFEDDGGFQRRVFADDSAQGFAFIDLCRKRYDVVVMNPPFGDASKAVVELLGKPYIAAGNDIGAAFVADAASRWCREGRIGVLLSVAPWFKPAFEQWRQATFLGGSATIQVAAHLSGEVLDGATVNASPFVLDAVAQEPAVIARLTRSNDLERDLGEVVSALPNGAADSRLFILPPAEAAFLPNKPFCYWASATLRHSLATLKAFEGSGGYVRTGLQTSDEERFCRAWWEIPPEEQAWKPYSKSSPFSPFWDDYTWSERIGDGLREVASFDKAKVQGIEFFWKPGVTYPSKSVLGFNVRLHPSGCGFAHSGCVAFSDKVSPTALLGFLGSRPVEYLISLFIGDLQGKAGVHPNQYEVGTLQRLPWPGLSSEQQSAIDDLASRCVDQLRTTNQTDEVTRSFVTPLTKSAASLRECAKAMVKAEGDAVAQIAALRTQIDSVVLTAYGFTTRDEAELEAAFSDRTPPASGKWRIFFGETGADLDIPAFASMVVSWAVGVAFGRWDIRYATGERSAPELPDPFAPLPVCSPGMLQGDDGLPLSPEAGRRLWTEGRYPLDVAWDGILVDDPAHTLDIERRVRDVIAVIWGDRADAIEHEACELLGTTGLREWFRRPAGFFADHLKRYSKSRRQAPIYWPLSTASGGYTLWISYHRLTDQTLFTAVNDFVDPRLDDVSKQLAGLRQKPARTKSEERELEGLADLQAELQDFRHELLRLAQLPWRPNLNDGVQITAAPLWKLFRLPKWQKTLKETWQKLEKGDYDWAHLAYTLWPDHVRDQCKTDKSLAIAHDLEALYEPPPQPAKRSRRRGSAVEDAQD